MSNLYETLEWPNQQFSYVKAPTVALFAGRELTEWGWTAEVHREAFPDRHFAERFKLHLADIVASEVPPLPPQFAKNGVVLVIADYLRAMVKDVILPCVRNTLRGVEMHEIRWCLTVPAIWSDSAKSKMEKAAQLAGLVRGRLSSEGSVHKLEIVPEPEAASLYCLYKLKLSLAQSTNKTDEYVMTFLGSIVSLISIQ